MIEDEHARLAIRAAGREPKDPENWSFDVTTALHDDMKAGGAYRTVRSRVTVSRQEFPSWPTASEVAGCMAVAVHGGMPIEILARY